VASEVGKGDDFGRTGANLRPGEFAAGNVAGDNVAVRIEAHDFHSDGRGTPGLDFVFVAEEIDTSFPTAVIEIPLDEHPEHGGLASVDITDDGNARLNHFLRCGRSLPYQQLTMARFVFWILCFSFVGPSDVVSK
jgi:hypothetical protein